MTKPKKMHFIDNAYVIQQRQIKKYGATIDQIKLVVKLQALYRGYVVRSYSSYVQKAMETSLYAEQR
jgi:hypothetical protein